MSLSVTTVRGMRALEDALGRERVLSEPDTCALYASDNTPHACAPVGVAFPRSHEEVAAIVRIANEYRLPLVARGAGSGNVGGALPAPGSLVVSIECMSRVLEFVPEDRVMVVQAGVVTADVDRLARTEGLFYPPDPGSAAYCRIGGNIGMNAAGPRSLKYGVTGNFVLGLRAVAGSGAALRSGTRTSKGVVGYDLTHLLVGSEGTLAIVSEATLRLLPAPQATATLRASYDSGPHACAAVTRVMRQRTVPSALEFMDAASLAAVRVAGAAQDLPPATRGLLLIEVDGEPEDLGRELEAVGAALAGDGLLDLSRATDPGEVELLWEARRSLSHAVKRIAPRKINEDVVVPVSRLAALLARIESLAETYRLPIVSFGHAGNGNLHVNLMVHPEDLTETMRACMCLRDLFRAVLDLGGTISGEHGIGSEKRHFVPMEVPAETLAMMRAIKQQFDPNGILNPGKLLP